MSDTHTTTGGVGFGGLLQVAFIVLKLTKVIDWSWFWVLSPTVFGISLWMLVFVIIVIVAIVKS